MSKDLNRGWLSRFRTENYRFAVRILASNWFHVYFFVIAASIFVRIAGVENNPHLFGWLLQIPDFVIQALMWIAIYPWIVLFTTPPDLRLLDKNERK